MRRLYMCNCRFVVPLRTSRLAQTAWSFSFDPKRARKELEELDCDPCLFWPSQTSCETGNRSGNKIRDCNYLGRPVVRR